MRNITLMIAGAVICIAAISSTSISEAGWRSQNEGVVSNVSYDVCKRRLKRGEECDYTYWQPLGRPDFFSSPGRRFHRTYWSFWPWW